MAEKMAENVMRRALFLSIVESWGKETEKTATEKVVYT
jgi:hypothetical protein